MSMYKVINKQIISENIKRLEVKAERVAIKAQPGQFVMVMADEHSSRIPLAIVESDARRGTITLIFEETDLSRQRLGAMRIGDSLFSVCGPSGKPADTHSTGTAVCIGYGVRAAQILPICRTLKKTGNKVIGILGAKTRCSLILESQMRLSSNKLFVVTRDGSYERKGSIAGIFNEIISKEKVKLVFIAGPVDVMHEVYEIAKKSGIKIRVILDVNTIDGIGLSGSSLVEVGGKQLDMCVDGPDVDGHSLDFDKLKIKNHGRNSYLHRLQLSNKNTSSHSTSSIFSGLLKKK